MKKIFLLAVVVLLTYSCSNNDDDCPNGKITSMTNVQDVYKISINNEPSFVVDKKTFDYYAENGPCYNGLIK